MYLQKSNDSKIADNSDISATLTFSKTWETHTIHVHGHSKSAAFLTIYNGFFLFHPLHYGA